MAVNKFTFDTTDRFLLSTHVYVYIILYILCYVDCMYGGVIILERNMKDIQAKLGT